jgi:hypothetical protein
LGIAGTGGIFSFRAGDVTFNTLVLLAVGESNKLSSSSYKVDGVVDVRSVALGVELFDTDEDGSGVLREGIDDEGALERFCSRELSRRDFLDCTDWRTSFASSSSKFDSGRSGL